MTMTTTPASLGLDLETSDEDRQQWKKRGDDAGRMSRDFAKVTDALTAANELNEEFRKTLFETQAAERDAEAELEAANKLLAAPVGDEVEDAARLLTATGQEAEQMARARDREAGAWYAHVAEICADVSALLRRQARSSAGMREALEPFAEEAADIAQAEEDCGVRTPDDMDVDNASLAGTNLKMRDLRRAALASDRKEPSDGT